ncbi:MAG: phosphodiesterase [Woeseia sp.]|nr:phosphodiesterase [Woeseia sp.]NNE61822.1 phosphodiesterase [Woeseia sp.]NNL53883.1 phosphodiesterase [Woeseia sp.]
MNLPGLSPSDQSNSDRRNAVMEISAAGKILNVFSWNAAGDESQADDLVGQQLDAVWPAELSVPIVKNARRAIRSQQVRSLRLKSATGVTTNEAILIVQGRDRVMVVLRDVSDIEGKVSRLERLAYLDKVSGLPNREWLMAELAVLTERLCLRGGRAALILIDITNLRVAERAYFEFSRATVIKKIAERLLDGLRGANEDIDVDHERYSAVARIDAQRFAVIVPKIETGGDAAVIAERLSDLLEQPIETHDKQFGLRVATGLALFSQDGRTAEELFENAKVALSDAVHSQTSSHKFHSGTVRMRALERGDLESELQSALAKEEFSLTYLPIVKAASRDVVSVEALLRWPTRSFGGQPVSEIINVAEYTGVIFSLGDWVFANAFQQLATWNNAGLDNLALAVNVSAQEFARGKLIERTERCLRQSDLDPGRVTIELSEQILFRDALNNFEICNGLRSLGIRMAIGDFGKGICSFEHLANSPLDAIKINMDLVSRANDGARGRAACSAIVALAHELGLSVVAEGVDSQELATACQEIGCDFLQGFLFSPPLDAERIAGFVASHESLHATTAAANG